MQILQPNLPLSYNMALEPYLKGDLLKLQERADKLRVNIVRKTFTLGGLPFELEFQFKGTALKSPTSPSFKNLPSNIREIIAGKIAESGWRTFTDGTYGNVSIHCTDVKLHGNHNIAINSKHLKINGDNSIVINSKGIESTKSGDSVYCDVNKGVKTGTTVLIDCPASRVFQTRLLKGISSPQITAIDSESVQSLHGRNNTFESTERSVAEGCVETKLDHCEDVKLTNCSHTLVKNTDTSSPLYSFANLSKITVDNGELLTRWVRFMKLFKRAPKTLPITP